MEIRRLDVGQFLLPQERVIFKSESKKSKMPFFQSIICYVLLILSVTGDCFFIGLISTLKEIVSTSGVHNFLLPLSIVLAVLHVVPFLFWLTYSLQNQNKKADKWYVLTDRRVCIVSVSKTLTVTSFDINQITSLKVVKDGVNLVVNEEKVSLDNMADASEFGAKLESLFAEENQEDFSPAVFEPITSEVSAEKVESESISNENSESLAQEEQSSESLERSEENHENQENLQENEQASEISEQKTSEIEDILLAVSQNAFAENQSSEEAHAEEGALQNEENSQENLSIEGEVATESATDGENKD